MGKQSLPSANPEPAAAASEQAPRSARELARYKVVPQRGQASFKVRYVEVSTDGHFECPFCVERI